MYVNQVKYDVIIYIDVIYWWNLLSIW